MFCGRTLNHRINRIHERALRIAYDDYLSDFEELLVEYNTLTIHKRSLRKLAIEMYKISNNLSPPFTRELITEIFFPYNMRSTTKVEENGNGSFNARKDLSTKSQVPKQFRMD